MMTGASAAAGSTTEESKPKPPAVTPKRPPLRPLKPQARSSKPPLHPLRTPSTRTYKPRKAVKRLTSAR
jgi:hypothetical protein